MRPARAALVLLAVVACPAGVAAQLQVSPTTIELGASAGATRLVVGNSGTEPLAVQVRVFAWTQVDGEDRLAPSDDLAVSPPIADVPAGGEQIVRLVRLGPAAEGRDRAYRVVIDELPGDSARTGGTVRVRLQYVLPVFVRAGSAAEPILTCRLEGPVRLACANDGGRAAQFGASRLVADRGDAVTLTDGLYGYVLPGSQRVWNLPAASAPAEGALEIETRVNGQPTTLPVERTP